MELTSRDIASNSASNPHGTVESSFPHRVSMAVWCGLIGDLLNGTSVLKQRLSAANCLHFLTNGISLLMHHVPLERRLRILSENDGVPPYFGTQVTAC